jgi:hypothetical protein
MSNREEWVKHITRKLIVYLDTPKNQRTPRPLKQKAAQEPWSVRWFGVFPMAIALFWKQKNRTRVSAMHAAPQGREANKNDRMHSTCLTEHNES